MLHVYDLGVVPASKDVLLLTRSRDRTEASMGVIANEVIRILIRNAICSG